MLKRTWVWIALVLAGCGSSSSEDYSLNYDVPGCKLEITASSKDELCQKLNTAGTCFVSERQKLRSERSCP